MKTLLQRLTILGFLIATTAVAGPTDYDGIITIDSVQAEPGDHPVLTVRLSNNDISVSGMTIPLQWDNNHLAFDSISLDGTVFGSDFAGYSSDNPEPGRVRLVIMPEDVDPPVPFASFIDGVVAQLHFTVSEEALPSRTTIDSIYHDEVLPGGIHVVTQIDISDPTGSDVYQPEFTPGEIEILAPTGVWDDGSTSLPATFALGPELPQSVQSLDHD